MYRACIERLNRISGTLKAAYKNYSFYPAENCQAISIWTVHISNERNRQDWFRFINVKLGC